MAVAMVGVGLSPIAVSSTASADAGDTGYRDFQYDPTVGDGTVAPSPTASKPQSKLWFSQDQWWGALKNPGDDRFHIYGFNPDVAAQEAGGAWEDTGIVADDRSGVRQVDVLWDSVDQRLFVLGHGREGSTTGIQVSTFTYDADAATGAGTWTSHGSQEVDTDGVEAAVIAKDSTGRLWVAYTADTERGKELQLVVSNGEQVFADPAVRFTPPVHGTTVDQDDIATVIAHDGVVSVVWSNQSSDPNNILLGAIYVATHPDAMDPQAGWSDSATIVTGTKAADDHISMTSVEGAGDGSIYVVVKTGADDVEGPDTRALIQLLVLRNGDWEVHPYADVASGLTRPIVLLEPSKRLVHVLATAPVGGGVIYEKTTSMDEPSFTVQGPGEPFIELASDPRVNDATSTKQNITPGRGMLVLASDRHTGYYVHRYLPGETAAVPEASFTASPSAGLAPLEVTFTDTSSNSATNWAWDFGDGGTSTEQNPTHTYRAAGSYTVSLIASNAGGSSTPVSNTVTVAAAPDGGGEGTGGGTGGAGGTGGGTGSDTSGGTANGDTGGGDTTTEPVAGFTSSPATGSSPLTVQFTDTTKGEPTSWSWSFGDGEASTTQNPSHTYTEPGRYKVTLTVSSPNGEDTAVDRHAVRVYGSARPAVSFSGHWHRFMRSAYVTAVWRNAADAAPAGSFDLRISVVGLRGRWSRQVVPMSSTGARFRGRPGSTYCLHVRGVDPAGSVGDYSAARCTAVPLDDRSLEQKGHWREQMPKRSYLGTALRTRVHGAALSKRVRARRVSLLVTKVPHGGRVAVYRGHTLIRHVSLRSTSVKRTRFVKIADYHRARTATFRVVVVSKRRPVIIDGLAVSRK